MSRSLAAALLTGLVLAPLSASAEGSLAFGRNSARSGVSYDYRSGRDADERALSECGSRDCRIVSRFSGQCAAIATGRNGGFGWATRSRMGDAERAAIDNCRSEGNRGCSVEARGCDG